MEVSDAVAAGRVADAVEQVGPPQRAVCRDDLCRPLAAAVLPAYKLAQFDPGAVLQGCVVEVNLEPMPRDDRAARQGEDLLHRTSAP
jgi:sulfur carrier protein ThiS